MWDFWLEIQLLEHFRTERDIGGGMIEMRFGSGIDAI
jgi:hypothetical protein